MTEIVGWDTYVSILAMSWLLYVLRVYPKACGISQGLYVMGISQGLYVMGISQGLYVMGISRGLYVIVCDGYQGSESRGFLPRPRPL